LENPCPHTTRSSNPGLTLDPTFLHPQPANCHLARLPAPPSRFMPHYVPLCLLAFVATPPGDSLMAPVPLIAHSTLMDVHGTSKVRHALNCTQQPKRCAWLARERPGAWLARERGNQSQCLLEWHPYEMDRHKGLNHQLASLSCMLSEAHYLERTAVLPAQMCANATDTGFP